MSRSPNKSPESLSLEKSLSNQSNRGLPARKKQGSKINEAYRTTVKKNAFNERENMQITQNSDELLEESDDDFDVSDHMLNDSVFLQRPNQVRGNSLGADHNSYQAYLGDYLS